MKSQSRFHGHYEHPRCEASALGVIYAQIRKAALRKLEHHRFQGSSKKSCCSIVASVEHRSREPSRSARTSAVVAAIGLVTFRTQQAWRALRSIHKQIGSLLESLLAPLAQELHFNKGLNFRSRF